MFKKTILATAIAISSSFATYNFFPVGKAYQGQVDFVSVYVWNDDFSTLQFPVSIKFNVIDNLELSVQKLGYVVWSELKDCEDLPQGCPDSDGLTAMTVGARYQFIPTQPKKPLFAAALDVLLPLSSEDVTNNGYDPFGFYGALQYIQIFNRELILGSELGMKWLFEDEYKFRGMDVKKEEGLQMTLKGELDYSFSFGLTPWVAFEFNKKFTEDKIDGEEDDGSDESQIDFRIGASYKFNSTFMIKANFIYSKGDLDGDHKVVNGIFSIMF